MRAIIAALSCALAAPALAQPLTTAFTYQGELTDGAAPASGVYDLQFALFDSSAGLTQVGPTLCADNVAVDNGRFTVQLDFGAVFAGQQRFLEVRVRPDTGLTCASSTGLTTLSPRTSLTAAPGAAFALTAASAATAASATNATQLNGQPASFYTNAANLTGTLPNARTTGATSSAANTLVLRDASGNFSAAAITATSFVGFGGNLTGLNAGNITAGTIDNSRTSGTSINAPNTLVMRNSSGGFDAGPLSASSLAGSGAAITALNASNIATGVLAATRGGTGLADQVPLAGQFLRSPVNGVWGIGNITAADLPALAGDITGSPASTSVSRLQGRTLNAPSPSTNQVLSFNGSQWVAATLPAPPSYAAGAGLSLSGTTFSVPANGITSPMLATDPASLSKVTGSMMVVSGANIGINTGSPQTDLHIRSAAPALTIEGDINTPNAATLLLLEDLGSANNYGGRITYDGSVDDLLIGTVNSGLTTTAIAIPRGTPNVVFSGTLTIPTTTRTLSLSGADFITNEFAHLSPNASAFPRINENGASGTVAHATAPVHLPEGAVITQFRIHVAGGGTVPITATLRRTPLTSQTTTIMATLTTAGASTYSTTTISSPTIDNDGNAYFVHFTWTNNGAHTLDINGAQITYTITNPLP